MFKELELARVYLKTLDWNVRAQTRLHKGRLLTDPASATRAATDSMLMDIKRDRWEEMQAAPEVD